MGLLTEGHDELTSGTGVFLAPGDILDGGSEEREGLPLTVDLRAKLGLI